MEAGVSMTDFILPPRDSNDAVEQIAVRLAESSTQALYVITSCQKMVLVNDYSSGSEECPMGYYEKVVIMRSAIQTFGVTFSPYKHCGRRNGVLKKTDFRKILPE